MVSPLKAITPILLFEGLAHKYLLLCSSVLDAVLVQMKCSDMMETDKPTSNVLKSI